MTPLFWVGAVIAAFGLFLVVHGMFATLQIPCSRRREFMELGGHVILIAAPIMAAGLILGSWDAAPITIAAMGVTCSFFSWKVQGGADTGIRLRHAWRFVGIGLVLIAIWTLRGTAPQTAGVSDAPTSHPHEPRR